jgi:hypothetical protein
MEPILKVIATLCAALFTGGALYISLVEHPARMADVTIALREFRDSYKRTAPWQDSTVVILALFEVPNTIIVEQEPQARLVRGLLVVEAFCAKTRVCALAAADTSARVLRRYSVGPR